MAIDPEEHRHPEGRTPESASREPPLFRSRSVAVPFAVRPPSETARAAPGVRKLATAQVVWGRWANWIVSVWAAIFSMIATGGYLYHRGQLAEIAAEHLRLMVTGPARLSADVAQRYTARTTTVTGHPLPAQVEVAVYGPGDELLTAHKEAADERGEVHVALRPDSRWPDKVRMVVVGTYSSRTERAETELAVVSPGHRTALSVFPPLCRGKQTLRYRSLSLASHSLSVDRELPIRFAIRDPKGSVLPDSVREGLTVQGVGWGQFTLPDQPAEGVYWLCATSLDNSFPEVRRPFAVRAERAAEPKPPAKGIRVRFRPEGGELVAGIENRVYFAAWDGHGRPARIAGRIVDRQNRTVAAVESTPQGIGSVQFEPQAGEQYRLQLDHDSKAEEKHLLPPVSVNHSVVLTTGLGVIEPHAPLEFNVRASADGLPLVATAFCRGIQVGQQTLVTSVGANSVSIPLSEGVAGTIRLRLHEYRSNPPRLLAERLVFRRPAVRLEVQAAVEDKSLRPAANVDLPLRIADEQGRPIAARLSVACWFFPSSTGAPVEPQQGGGKGDSRSSRAPGKAVETSPRGLPDAGWRPVAPEFLIFDELNLLPADGVAGEPLTWGLESMLPMPSLLSPGEGSSPTLDLLLGVFGPRPSRPNQDANPVGGAAAEPLGDCPPSMMLDNLQHLLERYQASLIAYRVNRTRVLNALTTMSFFGGVGLVMFVAMLSLLNIPCGLRLWGPSLGVAAACILIGAVLSNPERLKRNPGGDIAFTPNAAWAPPSPKAPRNATQAARSGEGLRPFAPPPPAMERPPQAMASGDAPAMILWEPLVSADASGRASVRVALPERSGAFQILVDAHADGGRFGSLRSPLRRCEDPAPQSPRQGQAPSGTSKSEGVSSR